MRTTQDAQAGSLERMVRRWNIGLHGCHDSTCFEMQLTDAEVETLRKVAAKAEETSTYGCMPTMTVEESSPNDPSSATGTRDAGQTKDL